MKGARNEAGERPPNRRKGTSAPNSQLLLRTRTEQLAETISEARSRFFFDLAPIGYAILDESGRVESVNLALSKMLNQVRAILTGTPFILSVAAEDRRRWLDYLHRCRHSAGEAVAVELQLVPRGDPPFAAHVITRLLSPSNERRTFLCAVVDVRERQRVEDELRSSEARLRDAAKELHARKSEAETASARLRELAGRMSRAEHYERERIAKMLHDDLQQLLVSAKIQLQLGRRTLGPRSAELAEAERLLDQVLAASRSLALRLSPPVLRDGGLEPGLRWFAAWLQDKDSLAVHLDWRGGPPDLKDDHLRSFAFEAVRELLLNVVKHAGVHEAWLRVVRQGASLRVEVADQGRGFDPDSMGASGANFGLFGLRERVHQLGGRFFLESAPGTGTCVAFELQAPARSEWSTPVNGDSEKSGSAGEGLEDPLESRRR